MHMLKMMSEYKNNVGEKINNLLTFYIYIQIFKSLEEVGEVKL